MQLFDDRGEAWEAASWINLVDRVISSVSIRLPRDVYERVDGKKCAGRGVVVAPYSEVARGGRGGVVVCG